MARQKFKGAVAPAAPEMPIPYALNGVATDQVGEVCKVSPPRNLARDLVRAEAFYMSLDEIGDYLPCAKYTPEWRAFRTLIAGEITDLRFQR